ncbi:MAG: membrane-bound PQQ-dependent dehydrogenase, glucose/quinate/shikimate family [Novosphingobium sp.]|nr:membrane-bound PQQ-dependent dehydrogenase, glucose/quinate/shikimate family [Novosphingobium sp.]
MLDHAKTYNRGAAVGLAALIGLPGLVLAVGGVWLALLGGSLYYAVVGIAMLAAGALLFRGRRIGLWVYVAVFALTVPWALWESGADPWALVPRLVGPTVILAVVAFASPLIDRRTGWRAALLGAVGSLAFLGIVLEGAALAHPGGATGTLPPAVNPAGPQATGADWPAWGGTNAGERFSTLGQITTGNVGQLQRVWVAHTGDLPKGRLEKGTYSPETTPIKIGDRLYMCSAMNVLIALDAGSGKELWRYDPKVSATSIPYGATCRGVAYYAGPTQTVAASSAPSGANCAARIIEGTLDGRLIAVDAADGRPCADFGVNGAIDTTVGLGHVDPGMASITAPPVIVRGMVVTGRQVLDNEKNDAPSGVIQAFDAVNGKRAWAWDLGRPGQSGWPEPGQTFTRGTPNMWTTAAADEQLGLVYVPLGNSADDYWSGDRSPEENNYNSSLVALDATTGKPVWRFQTVHKDVWDYDLGSQPTLIDLPNGTPAIILPSKQGDVYVLDRRTGRSLHGVVEKPVPGGGEEPAQRSPTQPFSGFANLRKPDLTERDMWGISPIDQMICRIQFRKASYKGFYTPPTAGRRWIEYPSYNGGSDWGSVAVDPTRGVIVANYNDMPNYNMLVSRQLADKKGWKPRGPEGNQGGSKAEGNGAAMAGVPFAVDVNAGWKLGLTGLLCKEPPYGWIRALDLATGRTIWDRPFGSARANGPWGVKLGLPWTIGTPNNGGSVVTAGGLIFIAATTDNLIHAIDLKTGKELWHDVLPGGGQANVMTYSANGRQYVVVMAGGHHFMNTPVSDALVAYALPSKS